MEKLHPLWTKEDEQKFKSEKNALITKDKVEAHLKKCPRLIRFLKQKHPEELELTQEMLNRIFFTVFGIKKVRLAARRKR